MGRRQRVWRAPPLFLPPAPDVDGLVAYRQIGRRHALGLLLQRGNRLLDVVSPGIHMRDALGMVVETADEQALLPEQRNARQQQAYGQPGRRCGSEPGHQLIKERGQDGQP